MLITLGIIGVVAAMTLPTLIQHHKKQEVSAKLKKFYSIMSQAILLSENDHGEIENWSRQGNLRDSDSDAQGLKNYNEIKNYWNEYYAPYIKTLKIERSTQNSSQNAKIYLADGSTLDVWNGGCMTINYDVNGDKNPNAGGVDMFSFNICERKSERIVYNGGNKILAPSGATVCTSRDIAKEKCESTANCSALLIMYDNFEFKDDYPIKL